MRPINSKYPYELVYESLARFLVFSKEAQMNSKSVQPATLSLVSLQISTEIIACGVQMQYLAIL